MLSRVVRRPLHARWYKASVLGDRGFSNPRQLSQLASRIHSSQGQIVASRPSLLSRPSICFKSLPLSAVRYASTDTTAPPTAPPTAPSTAPPPAEADLAPTTSFTDPIVETGTSSSPGFFERLNPLSVPEISTVVDHQPDTIGYLHSLGLDNGWGPTSVMQWVLEHIHVYTGLPWWVSVALTAVVVRTTFFPLFIRMSDNTARTKELQPLLAPLMQKQRQAVLDRDIMAQQQLRAEMFEVYRMTGVNPWLAFGSFAQIPFQVGAFIITRQMAYLPVPGMEQAGAGWFLDLTSADPFFILPAASSAFLYLSMKAGSQDLPSGQEGTAQMMKWLRVGLPVLSFGITCTMPSVLTLHFATSSILAYLQATFLNNKSVRAWLRLYPLKRDDSKTQIQKQALSAAAIAKIAADKETVKKEQERLAKASKGGMFSAVLNTTGGVGGGIKEQMRKSREEQEHKEYEKRAKQEDAARRNRGRKI